RRGTKKYKSRRGASRVARRSDNPSESPPAGTTAPPLQFPRGVGIDMLASGVEHRIPSDKADVPKFLQYGFTRVQSRELATLTGIDLSDPTNRPWPRFTPQITVGV